MGVSICLPNASATYRLVTRYYIYCMLLIEGVRVTLEGALIYCFRPNRAFLSTSCSLQVYLQVYPDGNR